MLAVVITAFNEADVLPRCVQSAEPLGEVHVSVDKQSTDASLFVARQLTPHVYTHEGLPADPPESDAAKSTEARNSYARMRNDVLEQVEAATNAQWLMWLDADEMVVQGHENLLAYLAQLNPNEYKTVIVPMILYTADGVEIRRLRNSKVIRRGTRFVRRRHEHVEFLPGDPPKSGICNDVVLAHLPSQPKEVRLEHDKRKGQYDPFEHDWREFRDSRAAFYVANYWQNVGQCETAMRWYEKALSLPPEKQTGLSAGQLEFYAAKCAIDIGDIAMARQLLFAVLEKDWHCGPVFFYLGGIAANAGDLKQARHWFNMALQYPEIPETMMEVESGYTTAMPLYGLAAVARKEGKRDEAYRLLAQAEQLMPYTEERFQQLRRLLDEDGADGLLYSGRRSAASG